MVYDIKNYKSKLNLLDTELAIKFIKDKFENELAKELNLIRVSAPLFVLEQTGLNDNLNGVEEPVSFNVKGIDGKIEIVHSLAKWKRSALKRYNIATHKGLYTDMNAIRKDEELDNLHSIYVDQWDYEFVIFKEERTKAYLVKTVKRIYKVLKKVEKQINRLYPVLNNKLPQDIKVISTKELEKLYPNLSRKERELEAVKEYKAIFLYQIGWPLKDGVPHDGRAPDYDDWKLNGDIIVYNEVLDCPFELSSMGIRVDEESIVKQLKERKQLNKLEDSPFVKSIINKELPYTLGGGIGQSRLCMFYLEKAHIGEVQASLWSNDDKEKMTEEGILYL